MCDMQLAIVVLPVGDAPVMVQRYVNSVQPSIHSVQRQVTMSRLS